MIVSLCSGYGGLDRAVAAAFRLPFAAHAEPVKVRLRKDGPLVENPVIDVLERRFPGVPNLGDITAIDWTPWRGLCRVLCAGFPCQPVSAAGRQLAEDDERWLWPSVHRAALDLMPEWIVLENVANIVSIKGGAIWRLIIGHLQEMGYGVAWGVFGACLVGGCHHRHRMFLVAHRGATGALRWPGKACGASAVTVLPTPIARDASSRGEGSPDYWATKRATGWTGGVPLGAELALLPTPIARDWRRVGPVGYARNSQLLPVAVMDLLPTPAARDGGNRGTSGDMQRRATIGRHGEPGVHKQLDLPGVARELPGDWGRFAGAVARHAAWMGEPPSPTEIGPRGGVRMAPAFPEWMMGLHQGYVTDVLGRNDALRAIGNGVMPQQGYYAIRELLQLLGA